MWWNSSFIDNIHSSEEEEDEVAGEEPEKEKKKKKIVDKEPVKNKLTGVKNKPKPRPKPKQAPATEANSNSRKSVRQSTIDKRYDPNEEKMEMKRKKSTKRVRQFTQGFNQWDYMIGII